MVKGMTYKERQKIKRLQEIKKRKLEKIKRKKNSAPMSKENLKCCGNCVNMYSECDAGKHPIWINNVCDFWEWDEIRDRTF